jgi:uncharacterized protein YggE
MVLRRYKSLKEVYMKTKILLFTGLLIILSLAFVGGCKSGGASETTTAAPPAASTPTLTVVSPPAVASPVVVPPPTFVSPPAASAPVNVNVNSQQGIWVSGQGIVTVTPDIATLNLGVSEQAAKVADAQAQAAADMTKVMSALTSNGVDQKDISTQYYNITQLTRYDNNTQQSVVTGYQVSNMVSVKIRTIGNVGKTIDAVAAAAGDAIRVNGISFSVDNPGQYYSQARTLAMNDAKAKATQLASLAGVTLGQPIYISESSPSTPGPIMAAGIAGAVPAPTTPISPGQTNITLNLQVGYAIQ